MSTYDAPNQQVVRADGSGPGIEEGGAAAAAPDQEATDDELLELTKDELIERAVELGVSPANQGMTKAELVDGIRQAEAQETPS